MYVRMYVCMYVRTYVRMYVCTYVCMYVCMYVRMYVCVCTVCMYVRMYSMYAYAYTEPADCGDGELTCRVPTICKEVIQHFCLSPFPCHLILSPIL